MYSEVGEDIAGWLATKELDTQSIAISCAIEDEFWKSLLQKNGSSLFQYHYLML